VPEFPLALTYDDVLLVPRRSDIGSRAQVDTTARFTRGLTVTAPVIAANMETVTEARMAIAMARVGGLGVINRFLPLAQQVSEVERVKRAENLVIAQPYAISGTATVADALELMAQREVRSLLVTMPDGRLDGILTTRDLVLAEPGDTVAQHATPRDRLVTASPGIPLDEAR